MILLRKHLNKLWETLFSKCEVKMVNTTNGFIEAEETKPPNARLFFPYLIFFLMSVYINYTTRYVQYAFIKLIVRHVCYAALTVTNFRKYTRRDAF